MKKLSLIVIAGVLLACIVMSYYSKKKAKHADLVYESRITVTGNARNISGHAAVVAPSAAVYYVEGLEQWEQDWLDQEVKITGDLVREQGRLAEKQERNVQRETATQVIKAAVVLLLQDDTQ